MKGTSDFDQFSQDRQENEYSSKSLILTAAIMLAVIFLISVFTGNNIFAPKNYCAICDNPIESGVVCANCGNICRRCGLIAAQPRYGYCKTCFQIVYGD